MSPSVRVASLAALGKILEAGTNPALAEPPYIWPTTRMSV
jgi:hypothetical protein